MNLNGIITFLIRDYKLVDKKKIILLILVVILWYYIYINFLLQIDMSGNVYLFGTGYVSKEVFDISLISMVSSLLFFAGITAIDLNDKISIGYSLVANQIKIVNMFIARSIFCIITFFLTIISVCIFFVYNGHNLNDILIISSNAILFTYTTYIMLVYLFSQKKVEFLLSAIVMLTVIYIPLFISIHVITILNLIYFVLSVILVLFFSENFYRNKLRDSIGGNGSGNYMFGLALYNVDIYLEFLALRLYSLIEKLLSKSYFKYQSIIYLDIQRNLKALKKFIIIVVFAFILKSDLMMMIMVTFIFYGNLTSLQLNNFKSDYWVFHTNLISKSGYIICKTATSMIFNFMLLFVFNILLGNTIYMILLNTFVGALFLAIFNLIIWRIYSLTRKL